jgi:hypothetical protein
MVIEIRLACGKSKKGIEIGGLKLKKRRFSICSTIQPVDRTLQALATTVSDLRRLYPFRDAFQSDTMLACLPLHLNKQAQSRGITVRTISLLGTETSLASALHCYFFNGVFRKRRSLKGVTMASKQRSSNGSASRKYRRHGNGFMRFMRGLVMESLGVVALVFLYLTMQASSAVELADRTGENVDGTPLAMMQSDNYASTWTLWQQTQARQVEQEKAALEMTWPIWSSKSVKR